MFNCKFNCSLLKDKEYLDVIDKTIKDETVKYAAKVYNMEKIDQNIHLTIGDRLFLETLLLEMRGTTIQYSTRLKKEQTNEEQKLIGEIEQLESQENDNLTALTEKKDKLEFLRNEKLNGVLVRSRVNWLKNGEKPSKYLCSLERKNYVEKTIKQLKTDNDSITTDQKEILKEIQTYYSNLFKSRNIDETPISSIIDDKNIGKLDDNTSKQLEGNLTAEEILCAIKNMKNDKSPGIDGFPVEFFKIFWGRIKFVVLRALNEGYEKGEMSETFKYAVITCIPKGTKARNLLKNWRPISLSVIYKINSASIANRLKLHLDYLISKTQTGFLTGRYIGENARLVYDILHETEKNKIPGLLMLIDSAFDSVSWSFLYRTLKLFNFQESFIRWIRTCNTNVKAYVIQSGFLSASINIERGCRQGDPIALYLFILCAQILCYMIIQNKKIRGINFNNTEIKISQYADDTTLILDGQDVSLHAALNTLKIYGTVSGLKVNTDKRQIVWIGKKKHAKEKLILGRIWFGAIQISIFWGLISRWI